MSSGNNESSPVAAMGNHFQFTYPSILPLQGEQLFPWTESHTSGLATNAFQADTQNHQSHNSIDMNSIGGLNGNMSPQPQNTINPGPLHGHIMISASNFGMPPQTPGMGHGFYFEAMNSYSPVPALTSTIPQMSLFWPQGQPYLYSPQWIYNWDAFRGEQRKNLQKRSRRGNGVHSGMSTYSTATNNQNVSLGTASTSKIHAHPLDLTVNHKPSNRARGSRFIILIRHGQYNMFTSNHTTASLTSLGRRQAELTGQRLEYWSGAHFNSFVCSTITRAVETAEVMLKEIWQSGLTITKDPTLCEGAPCISEPPILNWYPPTYDYNKDAIRFERAFKKYFYRADPEQEYDSYDVLICHANMISYLILRALQLPTEAWSRISLKNCSITVLKISPFGSVVTESIGDSGHIESDLSTFH